MKLQCKFICEPPAGDFVFLELIRRDYHVYIGKVGETEVDFVAEMPNDKVYIQVTESMQVPETRERELRPLRMIADNYEKTVLSVDRNYINSYDGIKVLNLIGYLINTVLNAAKTLSDMPAILLCRIQTGPFR